MRENGFAVAMPPSVAQQLADIGRSTSTPDAQKDMRDLRGLLWSSIDNGVPRSRPARSRRGGAGGATKVLVAVADVDAFVPKDSPIDQFAADQTTTVYMGIRNFPMLPERCRPAHIAPREGDKLAVSSSSSSRLPASWSTSVYRALVRNKAQLTYDSVGPWLDGSAPAPPKVQASSDLQAQLKLQNRAASALRNARHRHGALNIVTIESRPILRNQEVFSLETEERNGATTLIEDFMIAANEVVARLLEDRKLSFIQRVVRTPARWDRIVALAGISAVIWATPDSKA
jgi:exoribonuclease-2